VPSATEYEPTLRPATVCIAAGFSLVGWALLAVLAYCVAALT
jgi:hypothetical protein